MKKSSIKFQEPNEKVVLCRKNIDGSISPINIKEHLKEKADSLLGHGSFSIQFKEHLEEMDIDEWIQKRSSPEPFPDGAVLEDCHVHSINKDMDGLYSVNISWTRDRPLVVKYYEE